MTLPYTLSKLMTKRAVIARDQAERDQWGAEEKAQPVVVGDPIPCAYWWWRESSSGRSSTREYVSPQRTVDMRGGGMIVPRDADVRETDLVAEIQDPDGNTLFLGPFRIVAVERFDEHIECTLMTP